MNLRLFHNPGTFLLFFLLSCGARVEQHIYILENDGGADARDGVRDASREPEPSDAWLYLSCGPVDEIPAGAARIGTWSYQSSSRQFTLPDTCSASAIPAPIGTRKLSVETFWLDNTPTTNACYSECVKRGVCTSPEHDRADPDSRSWLDDHRAGKPVYVTHEQATRFCAWRGGHLPSLAQLARAAQGNGDIPGVEALTQTAIRCHEEADADPDACRRLENITVPPSAPYSVGKAADDVGPFGTNDIHGSINEWTRTYFSSGSYEFCALPDGAPDFVSLRQPSANHFEYTTVNYARNVKQAIEHPAHRFYFTAYPAETVSHDLGFRCAYDNPDAPFEDPGS